MRLTLLTRFSRTKCRRNDGTTAIEFAIIAPVLFLLLIGTFELGMIFFASSVIEAATNIGSRIGKTGYTSGGLTAEQYITQRMQQLSAGVLDPNQLTIDAVAYGNFASIGQPGAGTPGTGEGGEVVVYTVNYAWKIFTPLMSTVLGNPKHGIINLRAVATVRNEQF